MLITIPYPDANAYKVYNAIDNSLAIPTDWDYTTETWAVPTGRYCGENRYTGVLNELQFWIEPGCTLLIRPRDVIMLAIRLEWDLKSFYQDDGISVFTDRMAATLGIHAGDLKVVQVYEGSVIVEFMVTAPEDDPEPKATLKSVEKKFEEVIPTLGFNDLGAPVMQIVTSEGYVITMEGFEDMGDLANNPNFDNLIAQFEQARQDLWDQQTKKNTDKTADSSDASAQDLNSDSANEKSQEEQQRPVIKKKEYMTKIVE